MLSMIFDALISIIANARCPQNECRQYTGVNDIRLAMKKVESLQDTSQRLFQQRLAKPTGPSSHPQRIDGHVHPLMHQALMDAPAWTEDVERIVKAANVGTADMG